MARVRTLRPKRGGRSSCEGTASDGTFPFPRTGGAPNGTFAEPTSVAAYGKARRRPRAPTHGSRNRHPYPTAVVARLITHQPTANRPRDGADSGAEQAVLEHTPLVKPAADAAEDDTQR